jgi:hypothetical protein
MSFCQNMAFIFLPLSDCCGIENRLDHRGHLFLRVRQGVRVVSEGDSHILMTEPLTDHPQVYTSGEEQRRAGVS